MAQCNTLDWMMDDITFCPDLQCENTACRRNQKNFRCPDIPHSVYAEIPGDCLKLWDGIHLRTENKD